MILEDCMQRIKEDFGESCYKYVLDLVQNLQESPVARYYSILDRAQELERLQKIERQRLCRRYYDLFNIMVKELGSTEYQHNLPISLAEAQTILLLFDGYAWPDSEKQKNAQKNLVAVMYPLLNEIELNIGKKFYPKTVTVNPKGSPRIDEINIRSMEVEGLISMGMPIEKARKKVAIKFLRSPPTIRKPHKILMDQRNETKKLSEAYWKKRGKK